MREDLEIRISTVLRSRRRWRIRGSRVSPENLPEVLDMPFPTERFEIRRNGGCQRRARSTSCRPGPAAARRKTAAAEDFGFRPGGPNGRWTTPAVGRRTRRAFLSEGMVGRQVNGSRSPIPTRPTRDRERRSGSFGFRSSRSRFSSGIEGSVTFLQLLTSASSPGRACRWTGGVSRGKIDFA